MRSMKEEEESAPQELSQDKSHTICPFVPFHLPLDYLVHESIDILSREGVLERGHLMDAASQGPHIRLVVVGFAGEQLRAHIVRSSDNGVSKVTRAIEHSCDPQVTNLHHRGHHSHHTRGLEICRPALPM